VSETRHAPLHKVVARHPFDHARLPSLIDHVIRVLEVRGDPPHDAAEVYDFFFGATQWFWCIQLYERSGTEAADCAEGTAAFQTASPGTDEPHPRDKPSEDGGGIVHVLARLAQLFWLLPNPMGVAGLQALEQWLRRRLRSVQWKQWKRGRTRFTELRKRGVGPVLAAKTAGSAHGPWHLANSPALAIALPNAYFDSLGLPRLVAQEQLNPPNRRMRTRMSGGVAGARG
jgi:hypothetical protein